MRKSLLAALAVAVSGAVQASEPVSLRLNGLFRDHAVVQRGVRTPVWGDGAKPYALVTARLGAVRGTTRAASDGSFMFRLSAQEAGGPYVLEIEDESGRTARAEDVYVGEVWLASGQSNMEFRMRSCEPGPEPGDHPLIRQFVTKIEGAAAPLGDVRGEWRVATESVIPELGAVGYFFAERIAREHPGVAVGVILSALGGTSILSWSSRETLMGTESGRAALERYERDAADTNVWATVPQPVVDLGPEASERRGWARPDFDDSAWRDIELPNYMNVPACFGRAFNGAVWARRTVEIPKRWEGRELLLLGGRVDKHDVTYFNGVKVGASGFGFDEHFCMILRRYRIPRTLVKAGRATLAIRAWSHLHGLGIHGKPEDLALAPADDPTDVLPLAGTWKGTIERDLGKVVFGGAALPGNTGAPHALWDSALAPLVPYAIRGFLWYQGGNDKGNRDQYRAWQTAMVRDWRRAWGQGDLPFGLVLQAGYGARSGVCTAACARAELRDAQIGTADDLPRVGIVSSVDVGCVDDAHPKNKRAVGDRLAQWALREAYGRKTDGESPRLKSVVREGSALRVSFRNASGGLRTVAGTSSEVGCLALAGADGVWRPAKGRIDGETLVVTASDVSDPVSVRYAWTDFPDETANLENMEGLPGLPFDSSRGGAVRE